MHRPWYFCCQQQTKLATNNITTTPHTTNGPIVIYTEVIFWSLLSRGLPCNKRVTFSFSFVSLLKIKKRGEGGRKIKEESCCIWIDLSIDRSISSNCRVIESAQKFLQCISMILCKISHRNFTRQKINDLLLKMLHLTLFSVKPLIYSLILSLFTVSFFVFLWFFCYFLCLFECSFPCLGNSLPLLWLV